MARQIYAIIDIETTGARTDIDRITEVAIVLFDGEQIVDKFESLINPERSIPYNITQITGINDEMVADAPKFYEIAKTIVEMTQQAIFVAHNSRFDYNFIRKEFKALGYIFKRKQLCTVKLTRKVFPGLPSYSLGNLIKYFKIKVSRRHRAMDDTLATVEVFKRILAADGQEQTIDLVNLGIKESRLPPNITLERLHALPEACGVYYFYNQFNDVIYVGKSINIRKRVMSHFADDSRKSERIQQSVHDISFELTGSELIALLHEEKEVKRLKPQINRQLRKKKYRYCIHRVINPEGYLTFEVTETGDQLDVVKEFTGKREAKGTLAHIVKEFELCRCLCHLNKTNGQCFDFQLKNCHGAFYGKESVESYNERFTEAEEILRLFPSFPEDLLIIEEGRNLEELSVVLIESGQYKGFGFIDKHEANSLENLKGVIQHSPHNKDVTFIIKEFLRKNPKARIVRPHEFVG
ncbi:MAG: exonuclease domain-containing protein [Bacteroidota bacterium]